MDEDFVFIELPLYSDPDYYYTIPLEGRAYKVRLYYNVRMEAWAFDLRYGDDVPIVLGERIIPEYPMFADYVTDLSGFFYLESIGKDINETISNPYEIWKYYRFFYGYQEV